MAAAVVAGCGNSVPGNAVARVDDASITKVDFDRWFDVAASSNPAGKTDYSPPDFKACIASKTKTAPKPAKGQPATTDEQYKAQCKQEYEQLRDQALQFLILEKWVAGEANDQGIDVPAKEFQTDYEKAKKDAFPKEADFKTFLEQSGMTVADARFQVAFNTVYTKLREKAIKGAEKVTDAKIAEFYDKNKERFAQPETRDARVVLTKTKSKADAAVKALKSGDKFSAVAKRYSIDPASKDRGGALPGIAKGSQEKTFDDALFGAKKGELRGPVKVQFGYYVFKVQKITPAEQQSLKDSKAAIKQELEAQAQKAADDKFNAALRKKWKAKTSCREGYVMDQCKNAPKVETTAPTDQVPQQPPPQ